MSTQTETSRRRRPKGDKRERTRTKLIEATKALIREQGYEKTTLAGIAERAGMTTGAIYGNFKNREDLFMAVGEIAGAPIIPKITPGMSFAEEMHALAAAVIEAIPQRRAAIVGALGFHAYALTHEDFRARVVVATKDIYERFAAGLRERRSESELPMSAEHVVAIGHALIDGLLLHRFLTPELISDDVIYAAFAALANPQLKP
jgi:AcrR family transcriptional regulator